MGMRGRSPAEDSYLISYASGIAALPKTTLDRVVAGELVESLVRDRVVVIGSDAGASGARIYVPLFLESPWISELEYHGFALQTLLDGNIVREMNPVSAAALLAGLLGFVVVFAYLAGQRHAPLITLGVMAASVATTAVMLAFFNRSLPLVGMLLALSAYLTVTIAHRMRAKGAMLERLVRDVSVRVRERLKSDELIDRGASMGAGGGDGHGASGSQSLRLFRDDSRRGPLERSRSARLQRRRHRRTPPRLSPLAFHRCDRRRRSDAHDAPGAEDPRRR